MAFKKALKHEAKLRMALTGPSGSGKTYSALSIATAMGGRIALIDTERGSASKYADIFSFDVCELESFHPQRYIDAIREAEAAGYEIIIIDSLSHAWMGKDGALELVDRAAKASKSQNSYVAWRDITPLQNALVDSMIGARTHIIATLRTKTEYAQEKDDRGKTVIRKVGLAPVQRDGLEHEFDILGELDYQNTLVISKSRCSALQGVVIEKPGLEIAEILVVWLKGEPMPDPLSVKPKDAPSPRPPVAGKGKEAASYRRKLGVLVLDAGIDSQDFLRFLADRGGLQVGADGDLRLRDLSEDSAEALCGDPMGTLRGYRAWKGIKEFDLNATQEPATPAHGIDERAETVGETSAEKLSKAEALTPMVSRDAAGDYYVPSGSKEGVSYLVTGDQVGWTCQCDGYSFRAPKDPAYQCAHIMAAKLAAPALAGRAQF